METESWIIIIIIIQFKQNGTVQNKAVYKGNMGHSLRHRKAAHSTNTWPEVHTIDTTVQLQ